MAVELMVDRLGNRPPCTLVVWVRKLVPFVCHNFAVVAVAAAAADVIVAIATFVFRLQTMVKMVKVVVAVAMAALKVVLVEPQHRDELQMERLGDRGVRKVLLEVCMVLGLLYTMEELGVEVRVVVQLYSMVAAVDEESQSMVVVDNYHYTILNL